MRGTILFHSVVEEGVKVDGWDCSFSCVVLLALPLFLRVVSLWSGRTDLVLVVVHR